MKISWPRILDVYSLLTAITPAILDVLDLFCRRENIHLGANGNPDCRHLTWDVNESFLIVPDPHLFCMDCQTDHQRFVHSGQLSADRNQLPLGHGNWTVAPTDVHLNHLIAHTDLFINSIFLNLYNTNAPVCFKSLNIVRCNPPHITPILRQEVF